MGSERVDQVAEVYREWERGNFSAGVDLYDEGATLAIDPEIPDGGTYLGLEAIRDYMRSFLDPWESMTIAAASLRESGDSVLVEVDQRGVGRDSGVPVALRYFHVWTFRGEKVVRLESFLREEKALEAAGLSR